MKAHQSQPIDQTTETEGTEETPTPAKALAPPAVPPETKPGTENTQADGIPQEMLFREAEVIAQNLKESGTRR